MSAGTPAPIRIWRDPTRRDVEELLATQGGELAVLSEGLGVRGYHARFADGEYFRLQGHVSTGQRPDWRAMLRKLGSDWA